MVTLPKTTATRQFAGLVLAPVRLDALDTLRVLLKQIGEETTAGMKGKGPAAPLVPFPALTTIHYARFVLLERDTELGPWLAFSTNYDGPEGEDHCTARRALGLHIEELVSHAGEGLERVFACCEGYRSGRLAAFLRKKQVPAATFYVGSSGRSRNQILWEAELRREVDRILDSRSFDAASPERVRGAVLEGLKVRYPAIPTFPPQPDLSARANVAKGFVAAFGVLVLGAITLQWGLPGLLIAIVVATALVWRFRRLEITDLQFQPEYSDATLQRFVDASAEENDFLQNQLTHLSIVKPGPIRWLLIRVVFAALDILARNVYNKGKLGGIPSIHFARWVLLPKRRVLFFSNFDSSWQSYLGDFIDQASSGLTAVWSNTREYPRTTWLLRAGSRDAARFLAWTRHNQHPTQVWYSAYPGISIVDINSNTEIRRGLAEPSSVDAVNWLFRLRSVDRVAADELYGDERRQPPLPTPDIQGIILWGYGHVPEARYLMFRVARRSQALLEWIAALPLTSADGSKTAEPPEPLNIAFTYRGLLALGADAGLCQRFSTPFVQGSDDPYRARVNGDVGPDAPERWHWGSRNNPVDLVLLVYAKDAASAALRAEALTSQGVSHGLELVASLEGTTLPGRKEHFGFRDGIAQPTVQGSGRGELEGNTVAAGEFLLGHRDAYGNVSHSPESPAGFAFGRNGSYLVFRQLEQNVEAFWRYAAAQHGVDPVTIASKMVGRWPSGASLVRHPEADPESRRFQDEDAFTYLANDQDNDRYGARCPFGAHIRRTNPRDWQLGATPAESLTLSNLHRILRRGRPYGPPLDPSMQSRSLIQRSLNGGGSEPAVARGLQFLCFNANLERQFEFIQQQWCNNPKFAGQNSDADPLLGMRQESSEIGTDPAVFTIQSDVKVNVARRALDMQRFVRVVGSAYFFMPSIPAVKLLAGEVCRQSVATALEAVPPDEQLHIDSLIDTLRERMKRDYLGQRTLRDAHPKMHGCVRALFHVEPELDPRLSVGLFREPKTYRAWVRFSNASGTVQDDGKRDIRGVAIKLLDVPGAKLLEGSEDCLTHDLVMISTDFFLTRDVAGFDALVQALFGSGLAKLRYFAANPGVVYRLLTSMKHHESPLEIRYFSVVPYLFGERAVKYSLVPASQGPRGAKGGGPDHLREALKAGLANDTARFDFLVQLPDRPEKYPIEDARVAWRGSGAPFVKLATLELPAQQFDTRERRNFGENLSFNPWRCLPEHRPLGGISRARRQVYRTLSGFRHDRNDAPNQEPDTWE